MKKFLFVLILIVAIASPVYSANHYFSQAGNDTTGDGSIGTPWKSLDKASTECGNGDTCYFNKGDTWDLTQAENQQAPFGYGMGMIVGASNVTITSYGTGNAPIFDGGTNTALRTFIYGASKTGVIIDGITFQNGYADSSTCGAEGTCHGIYSDTASFEVRNSTFTSLYNGVYINGAGCNNLIHDNTFTTMAHDGIFAFVPGNCTASKNQYYQNTFSGMTYNGVDVVGSGDGSNASGNQIYKNYVNDANNCIEFSRANSNEVWSNVLNNCHSDGSSMLGGILVAVGSNSNLIYNNTVYNSYYGLIIGQYTGASCTEQGTANQAKNNITSSSTIAEIHLCTGKTNVLSNNLSYKSTGAILKADNITTSTATWTSTYDAAAVYTDPQFINVSSPPSGLSIQPSSPAREAGTALGSPYNVDYGSVPRPQGTLWDIGAYEYTGTGLPTITDPIPSGSQPCGDITLGVTTAGAASTCKYTDDISASSGNTEAMYPASNASVAQAPYDDIAWTTPGNIYADDGSTANVTSPSFDANKYTQVLKGYNFDMSAVPDGATILGVEAKINAWNRSGTGAAKMDLCQLLDTSGNKVGTNLCSADGNLSTTNTTVITKGGASNNWGNSLTSTWVKNSNFGIALGIMATANNSDVDVDYVTLKVYWSLNPSYATYPNTYDSDSTPQTTHTSVISGLTCNQSYTYYTLCSDGTNINSTPTQSTFFLEAADTTPPVILNGLPSGQIACGEDPLTVSLQVQTNENANCRYKTTTDTYDNMVLNFETGQGTTNHSQSLSRACNATYNIYVACADLVSPTPNKSDPTTVTFEITSFDQPPPDKQSIAATGVMTIGATGGMRIE